MVENLKSNIRTIPQSDFEQLLSWMIGEERQRRATAPAVEAAQAGVVRDLREQGAVETPAAPADPTDPGAYPEWVNPGTIHARMYLLGDRVQHQGRVWESNHPGLNHWEPDTTGVDYRIWRDITDEITTSEPDSGENGAPEPGEPSVPAFKAGESVAPGDLREYQGIVYRVIQGHTTANHWAPDVAHSLWSVEK